MYKLSKDQKIELKQIQCKFCDPYLSEKNPNYKAEWEFISKREYPWNGVMSLIAYKIETMRIYLEGLKGEKHYDYSSWLAEEEIDKQLSEMNEVLEVYYRIMDDAYLNKWHEYFNANTTPYVIISRGNEELTRIPNVDMFDGVLDDKPGSLIKVKEWCQENKVDYDTVRDCYTSEWNGNEEEQHLHEAKSKELMKEATNSLNEDIKLFYELLGKYSWNWGD